jgi:RHS repeat-associated protein
MPMQIAGSLTSKTTRAPVSGAKIVPLINVKNDASQLAPVNTDTNGRFTVTLDDSQLKQFQTTDAKTYLFFRVFLGDSVKPVLDTHQTAVYIDAIVEHHVYDTEENTSIHLMDNQRRLAIIRVGQALNGDTGAAVQYHLADHLDSSTLVLGGDDSTAGTFQNREEFFPYGETSFGSFARKRYRFSGKERDEESGLYYGGMRYYSGSTMRWTSGDPAGPASDINLYSFNRCSPLRFVDPNGTQSADTIADAGSVAAPSGTPPEPPKANQLVYSGAFASERKEEIDKKLAQQGITVDPTNPDYWKAFITQISDGKINVKTDAKSLQFFLISGGMEGFLQPQYSKNGDQTMFSVPADPAGSFDLDHLIFPRANSDANDALVIFDRSGKQLLGVFQLVFPNQVGENAGKTEKVLSSWDNKIMGAYGNTHYEHPYRGLTVDPGADPYKKEGPGQWWVDIHAMIGTNGCVEISPVDRYDKFLTTNSRNEVTALGALFDNYKIQEKTKFTPLGVVRVIGYESQPTPAWLHK